MPTDDFILIFRLSKPLAGYHYLVIWVAAAVYALLYPVNK